MPHYKYYYCPRPELAIKISCTETRLYHEHWAEFIKLQFGMHKISIQWYLSLCFIITIILIIIIPRRWTEGARWAWPDLVDTVGFEGAEQSPFTPSLVQIGSGERSAGADKGVEGGHSEHAHTPQQPFGVLWYSCQQCLKKWEYIHVEKEHQDLKKSWSQWDDIFERHVRACMFFFSFSVTLFQ